MGAGLYDPLGPRPAVPGRRRTLSVPIVVAGLVGGAVAIVATLAALRGGDASGEPSAVVRIDRTPVATVVTPAPSSAPPSAPQAPAAPAASQSATAAQAAPQMGAVGGRAADVEIQNGVRIIRMRPEGLPGGSQGLPVPAPSIPAR